jgi:hypothetical protein
MSTFHWRPDTPDRFSSEVAIADVDEFIGRIDAENGEVLAIRRPDDLRAALRGLTFDGDKARVTRVGLHRSADGSLDHQIDLGVGRIVGEDLNRLGNGPAEAAGIDLGADLAALPGGDGAVEISHGTPASGLDFGDLQDGIAVIADDKTVSQPISSLHRTEVFDGLGHHGPGLGSVDLVGGKSAESQSECYQHENGLCGLILHRWSTSCSALSRRSAPAAG